MIDFSLHSDLTAKTKESSSAAHGLVGDLLSGNEEGKNLKEEFTKALQEMLGTNIEGKDNQELQKIVDDNLDVGEVKLLLENTKNKLVQGNEESEQSESKIDSVLKQLIVKNDQAQNPEALAKPEGLGQEAIITQKQFENHPEAQRDINVQARPKVDITSGSHLLQKSAELELPQPMSKVTVHDLLLEKSIDHPVMKEAVLSQMNQAKPSAKMLLVGGDDFLAQKIAVDKNQLINVDGEKVTTQKILTSTTPTHSMKQYGAEQNILDNRMFTLRASDGEGQPLMNKITSSEGSVDDLELLGEVSNGSERLANKLVVNNTQNEAQVDISTATKVLDLSKIDITKTNELITKISEYIEQAQFEKTQKLDIVVKHDQLGQFKIQVNKTAAGSDLIDLKIQSSNAQAHKFFVDNEVDLLQSLSNSGIKVADLKITTGLDSSSLSQQGSQEHKDSRDPRGQMDGGQKSANSQDSKSQDDRGAQKRKDLWEFYKERYSA